MPNRNYNHSANPAFRSSGSSALIRTEFDAINTGFTRVEIELDAKAPISSPAFTGVPTAPTAATGTSTSQLATMEALQNAAFASATNIPGQTGNKWGLLKTDGVDTSFVKGAFLAFLSQTSSTSTYNADNSVNVTTYASGHKATMGYTSGNLTTVVYTDSDGTTTMFTETLTYTGGKLTADDWS
jgi:hypothetical protein